MCCRWRCWRVVRWYNSGMKIAVTGGSGFVGSKLSALLAAQGHDVLVLDRFPPRTEVEGVRFASTDLVHDLPLEEFLACDAVVHLAGVNIFARWTDAYKRMILSSRAETAHALIEAARVFGRGPRIFVSASAVGYYGDGGEAVLAESSPNGSDFLASVCGKWEAAAQAAETAGMRWVSVRTGIVIGPGGGMLAKLLPFFRLGLGGPMGSGRQWFSWISLDDLLAVYVAAISDDRMRGPVNAVSPNPVRNRELARAIGAAVRRPAFLPLPGFALRLILGELGGVVLMSQRAVPQKLNELGFVFESPDIREALRAAVGKEAASQ